MAHQDVKVLWVEGPGGVVAMVVQKSNMSLQTLNT